MRILHELNQLDFGGAEKVVRNIIKFDKKNKHTILAYQDGSYREELEKAGAKIMFSPKQDEPMTCETDIIHVHSGGQISKLAVQLGKHFPIIETIHSPIRSPMKNDVITQRVGVTNAVSKVNHNCITIHNGIDMTEMLRTKSKAEVKKELGIESGIPVIGRLGRIGRDKYLEEWLIVCNKLQNMGLNFIPLIVGDEARNANGYLGRLKLIAECLPVKDVVWAGHRSDIANYLQIMDIFLYPSFTEGFGLVFIESLSMGCNVVTLKNNVTEEILGTTPSKLVSGIDGLVQGVLESLEIIEDKSYKYKYVHENFSAKTMSEKYQAVYENVRNERTINK